MWTEIAVALAVSIGLINSAFCHMALTNRPIFIGFITGLLLGDIETGILIGAQLELAFLGIVSIGATSAADPLSATVMTVTFSIANGLPMETVIPLGVTIGYAASVLANIPYVLMEFFTPSIDKCLKNGQKKRYYLVSILANIVCLFAFTILICEIGVMIGGPILESFVNSLPPFVMTGINTAGMILPSLGVAMILSLVFGKSTAIYFFVGFVVFKYLEVDMTFCLIIGLLLAIMDFTMNKQKIAPESSVSNEEEFLS